MIFKYFSIHENIDFVEVLHLDEVVFEATGRDVPESITSTGNSLIVFFDSVSWTVGHRGFLLELFLNSVNGKY